ncbi:hypothetical protein DID80_02160 [Candidatus Marinamargulisbacteria bacterium SCGC AAA071-K20]|nr:hypothetical protein DID80_02160 [Candidatus Marinamargulisbacteria bacterium SCGC AAA071-K20]
MINKLKLKAFNTRKNIIIVIKSWSELSGSVMYINPNTGIQEREELDNIIFLRFSGFKDNTTWKELDKKFKNEFNKEIFHSILKQEDSPPENLVSLFKNKTLGKQHWEGEDIYNGDILEVCAEELKELKLISSSYKEKTAQLNVFFFDGCFSIKHPSLTKNHFPLYLIKSLTTKIKGNFYTTVQQSTVVT